MKHIHAKNFLYDLRTKHDLKRLRRLDRANNMTILHMIHRITKQRFKHVIMILMGALFVKISFSLLVSFELDFKYVGHCDVRI